ncbi:hypothetical protein DM860_002466 [Cuscuta australis]|uniref:non-specific serine/threonine protein kinase n=1 Tax=Cuscuta australis TaxID=267555 RepID=A0A328D1H3_9ASTE|nr:hypothetical protein DM860_002466 [Cuscuta australis]
MGNAESSASSSPCEGSGDAAEENEDVEIIDIEPKLLFCTSISLTAEEMQCLKLEEDHTNKGLTRETEDINLTTEGVEEHEKHALETLEEEDNEAEFLEEGMTHKLLSETEKTTSKHGFLPPMLTNADGKTHSQWYGFFKKLKKGPGVSLQTFHPAIPSLYSFRKHSKKRSRKNMVPPQMDADIVPHFFETSWKNFSLSELEKATDNFNDEYLIGKGGYSEVYKGNLEDGRLVAVKRLMKGNPEEMTSDYLSELGILVHVNHPNIANVIGYGVEGGMYLVLPLSPHGSLANLLDGSDQKEKLPWCFRYNISLGIASGLAYLHEECHRRIIHRDIKASNVLLTEDFEPQISDFGLAKWLPDKWSHLTVSQFEGTFGYLPPEFFVHGIVDEKTDVYAYGVLLLEIISGRPALDQSNNSVVMWAKPLLLKKSYGELADPALGGAYDLEQMNDMAMVASLCLQQSSVDRPPMSKVEKMLKGEESISQDIKKLQNRPSLRTRPTELDTPKSSNNSPKSSNDTPKSSKGSPKSSNDTPKMLNDSPKSTSGTPKSVRVDAGERNEFTLEQ